MDNNVPLSNMQLRCFIFDPFKVELIWYPADRPLLEKTLTLLIKGQFYGSLAGKITHLS